MNSKINLAVKAIVGLYLSACAAAALQPAPSEPANPRAPVGVILRSSALGMAYDAEALGGSPSNTGDEHASHAHEEKTEPHTAHAHAGHAHEVKAKLHADHSHANHAHSEGSPAADEPADNSMYTCSMHPEVVHKGPGSCPICGMKLVPKRGYE